MNWTEWNYNSTCNANTSPIIITSKPKLLVSSWKDLSDIIIISIFCFWEELLT
jgi:hypothetical protein